nr:cell division protein SepF [Petrachloros mirabilis]
MEKVRKFVLPDPEDDYAYSEEGYDDIQNNDGFDDGYYPSHESGMDLEQEFLTQPVSVSSETNSMNSGLNNVIGMPNNRIWGSATEVLVMEPRAFEEMPQVIQALRDRKSVVLNLTMMDPVQAQRAVDFVAGATYTIDGHQERVGESIFLFTPSCVQVSTQAGVVHEVPTPTTAPRPAQSWQSEMPMRLAQ